MSRTRRPRKTARAYNVWNPAWGLCPLHPSHKRRYPSKGAAKAAARMMPERGIVYRCATCGDYHLARATGIGAAIRYLEASLHDDLRQAAKRQKGPYVPA